MCAGILNKGHKKMMNMWQDINVITFCISDMNACHVEAMKAVCPG